MKKKILSLAFVAAVVTSIASGCSSMNETTTNSDSAVMDSNSTTMPADTARTDTDKTDTTARPAQ
ncbi:hypothetical protein [Mucilaginibacter auburnensis]|uniref:Coproporphyrinogen III oxidase n=1 Tax=Mucilaginibacter auburnensis TaxID=1457233 RepID=A0A2H9VL41_9SPHI|nr:hypothetical protein [Mucilaginibacter auburnensis]PJJ79054.1 hypothetical protein CLV57_2178 [Mucilaginibacter auburnensis]